MRLSTFETGYLAAVLETDAGIYHEARPNGRRRAALDIQVSSQSLAERLAELLGVDSITTRESKPRGDVAFARPTFRVRLRGHKARAVLASMRECLTADGRARVDAVLAATAPAD